MESEYHPMGSYYQQKKNYNKYNPTQSFSDMDCYGNDYFGNNSENKEHSTNIYGNNAFKPIKSNTFNKNSSYSTSSYSKKNPPSSFLFFIYMFFSVIGIILVQSIGSNIIETHGRIFLRAFLWTIFESPIIYFLVWKMFLSKILNAFVDSENEIATCGFYSLIGIPICAIIINMGIIEHLNSSWDKSESVKWYLTVINIGIQKLIQRHIHIMFILLLGYHAILLKKKLQAMNTATLMSTMLFV